jgi:hypothetical protein
MGPEGIVLLRILLASGDFGTSPFFGQLFSLRNLLDRIATYHSFKAQRLVNSLGVRSSAARFRRSGYCDPVLRHPV